MSLLTHDLEWINDGEKERSRKLKGELTGDGLGRMRCSLLSSPAVICGL